MVAREVSRILRREMRGLSEERLMCIFALRLGMEKAFMSIGYGYGA